MYIKHAGPANKIKAQSDIVFTFLSSFKFLFNNLTEPNKKFGKDLNDIFLNIIFRCFFINTVPIYQP